jgi:predicted nucleic acid-binding Zn ribbon protein
MTEPKRLADILGGAVSRAFASDQARAYTTWMKAIGPDIAAATRPRRFSRGTLTVRCESSVWANELTYLADVILAKMSEVDPGHPVRRLRFEAGSGPAEQGDEPFASNSGPESNADTGAER